MKDFIPYEQALALKELGFDEAISTYYSYPDNELGYTMDAHNRVSVRRNSQFGYAVSAPTFSQAFRWFREKYELHSYIQADYSWNISGGIWDLNGYKGSRYDWDSEAYLSYEEAELACLIKLIEIVKTK